MDEEIKTMLDEAIKSQIRDLSNLQSGEDKKSTAIEDLAKLYKLRLEETKTELNFEESVKNRTLDDDFKHSQLEEQVKDRYFRLGMDAAKLVLPLIFYAVWMRKGFKFEEAGTFTSTTFRGLFNCFKPTLK